MNRQLTVQETKNIMIALGLLLALCGVGSVAARKTGAEREEERMGQLMDREAELARPVRGAGALELVENDPEKALLKNQHPQF